VPITLDHLIVPARDNEAAAERFARIMGLYFGDPDGHLWEVLATE
jgi:predicted lactoylglutathione lyase